MPKIIKLAKGSYTTSDITIDSSGRVITASSGTAGGGAMIMQYAFRGPATGTFATNNGNYAMVYAASGAGGGGGSGTTNTLSKAGGHGAWGLYNFPTGPGFSKAYVAGAGGSGGTTAYYGNAGQAGQATSITDTLTINAGNGGGGTNQSAGTNGSAPGAVTNASGAGVDNANSAYCTMFGQVMYDSGNSQQAVGKGGPGIQTQQGNSSKAGAPGVLVIFENVGA
tara:strand:- start:1407 stop:2078 length:672 start_codon:yes stop_codon:yes gene_type:complete